MFIRAENLSHRTIEDIDEMRRKGMQHSLDVSHRMFEEDQKRHAKRVSNYPDYAFKPSEELTQKERQMIIDFFFDKQIAMLQALGPFAMSKDEVKSTVKQLKEKRKAPIGDEEFEDMRKDIFPPLEADDPNEDRIKQEFEHEIYFAIGKSSLLTGDFDRLCETIKQYQARGMKINVLIDSKMSEKSNAEKADYVYSPEEKAKVIQLHKLINEHGTGEIRFKELNSVSEDVSDSLDFGTAWTMRDVATANKSLDAIVETIKLNNLSPFETMVFIHEYITSTFAYKEGGLESCRVIPGAFKNGEIVCSGYASMVKAIIDKLDNKDLSCDIVGCTLYKGKLLSRMEGGHAHNMIHIRDPKYGIDGVYMEDACWDSKRENFPEGRGFAHCLYPVTDLEHFRGATYVPSTSQDRFSNLIIDTQNKDAKNVVRTSTLPRPWMVEKYGTHSKPIPLEKYEECLKRVYALKLEGDQAKVEEKVDTALRTSVFIAKHEFKHGDSCFASTERYGIKGKGEFSLAENDGRPPKTETETEKE